MFRLTGLYCASNPPLCVVNVNGGLKTHNVRVEVSTRCFQYTASSERDEPRSLRKNGYAGTGRALRKRTS